MNNAVYKIITDQIIQLLEKGTVPWHQPWNSAAFSTHQNLPTKRSYRGINHFLLTARQIISGYSLPLWLTFKQARAAGGSVRAGEKGTTVVFWKRPPGGTTEADESEDEALERRAPILRYFTVFNHDQCDLPERVRAAVQSILEAQATTTFHPLEAAAAVFEGMPRPPQLVHGGNRACYATQLDRVSMPLPQAFESPELYYSVLWHELTHSTGHPERLNRKGFADPAPFGSEDYSQEELVAELGAAFLRAHTRIETPKALGLSASYIQHWISKLRQEPRLLVIAAAQAQRAVDLILGHQSQEPDGPHEEPARLN